MTETAAEQNDMQRVKINQETAKIAWLELQRFFANGSLIAVTEELDLVEVALHFSNDNKAPINTWMQAGKLGKVSDQQAQNWLAANTVFWSVVIKPWVLIQPVVNNTKQPPAKRRVG
ncbi:DUF2288 domain-containing protein [Candidatus Venteria ishoeyi]|uniref:DUF2288 domain-containing protein n=1 Tax=Candidatus Venteria ishoeyi TaxID=1899563 RepID=UPI0025A57DDA|nr:DUF2288 domain-containing protein [Candidatus Venteria ishoeyi]